MDSQCTELSALYPLSIVDHSQQGLLPVLLTLSEGVRIFPYSNRDERLIQIAGRFPELIQKFEGSFSHFIEVDLGAYRKFLRCIVSDPELVDQQSENVLLKQACEGVLKQVLLALALADYSFGYYSAPKYLHIREEKIVAYGCCSNDVVGIRPMVIPLQGAPWDPTCFLNWYGLLQDFYKPIQPVDDRLAVALHSFLMGIASRHVDQRIMGLSVVFEAILGNDQAGGELTHQLAERISIALETCPDERYDLYKRFKELYNYRSFFAHGNLKGQKLFKVDANGARSASDESQGEQKVHQLKLLAIRLLKAVFENPSWRSALSGKTSEFYIRWTLGKVPSPGDFQSSTT